MNDKNNKVLSIFDEQYQQWLKELKTRYKQSQIKASIKVNEELLKFYWLLGRDIVKMQAEQKWGDNFFQKLSSDLKKDLPNIKGFSIRNLQYMKRFYELFPYNEIAQQLVAQINNDLNISKKSIIFLIPWGHIIAILSKGIKTDNEALFYIQHSIDNGWSRSTLNNFIDTNLYNRQGKAINNFEYHLPKENSDLAQQITKDPYNFDFLTLSENYDEKELKECLIDNIQKFLLELGSGFAYMGKEYHIEIDDRDIYLDLLFYNTEIHAYVVVEVKIKEFTPGDIGQLGTYVVAVDHELRKDKDEKTIGLLVCKNKSEILARYALEASSQPIGISSYKLSKLVPENFKSSLPTIEEIENELKSK